MYIYREGHGASPIICFGHYIASCLERSHSLFAFSRSLHLFSFWVVCYFTQLVALVGHWQHLLTPPGLFDLESIVPPSQGYNDRYITLSLEVYCFNGKSATNSWT